MWFGHLVRRFLCKANTEDKMLSSKLGGKASSIESVMFSQHPDAVMQWCHSTLLRLFSSAIVCWSKYLPTLSVHRHLCLRSCSCGWCHRSRCLLVRDSGLVNWHWWFWIFMIFSTLGTINELDKSVQSGWFPFAFQVRLLFIFFLEPS